ncbi:VOC family protein [Halostreptopolyspora alba]|uniref:VOC family protein n=1 Tax=Halostreptopolyspora alba TaxID=2487137 RepID=A0A3N0EI96_9ACTN|nr:VOC family protein [Nocardiopsaceae bacterium YIM 96095]
MSDKVSNTFVWRRVADSSGFTEPRVLVRVFVSPGELERSVRFYEGLQGVTADMRFSYPEVGLRLAAVGAFLVIEGTDEELRPFRSTTGTLLVDDIGPYHEWLVAAGAEVIFGPREVPTGAAFNVRHPDGSVVEYVHHRPLEHERKEESGNSTQPR